MAKHWTKRGYCRDRQKAEAIFERLARERRLAAAGARPAPPPKAAPSGNR